MSDSINRFKGRNEIQAEIDAAFSDTDGDSYPNTILVNNGLDAAASGGTLDIGATNASIINIGVSGAVVNILGATVYEQVTNVQSADKLITINKGGSTSSGAAAGIEIEENSLIKGYIKTSSDRNSFSILAPNTAGVVTLTPGSGGFTLDQGSHNPVTLGAVGSSPSANGASLSSQVLTLQPADATHPGVVTIAAQIIAGAKTLNDVLTLASYTTTNRDLLTPVAGMVIFNSSTSKHQGYDGSVWQDLY